MFVKQDTEVSAENVKMEIIDIWIQNEWTSTEFEKYALTKQNINCSSKYAVNEIQVFLCSII